MNSVQLQRLVTEARALSVDLDERACGILERYVDLLQFWNRKISLTSVRDEAGIVDKHLLDSLAVVPHVPTDARTLVDVGSGAGLPGAVLAAVLPQLAVTLVESNQKKGAFLQAVRREVPLSNLEVRAVRVERLWEETGFRAYDVAVSRATWDVGSWLSIGSRLVRPDGGIVLGMEGLEQLELPRGTSRYSYKIAGARRALVVQTLGSGDPKASGG
jgi:16S rRNA (guanine527-N7)-methyltransferase